MFSDDVVNYTNWYTGSPRFPSKTSYAVLTQFCVDLILKIVYFVLYEEITYQHKIKYILNGELVTAWVDIKYKYVSLYLLCEKLLDFLWKLIKYRLPMNQSAIISSVRTGHWKKLPKSS